MKLNLDINGKCYTFYRSINSNYQDKFNRGVKLAYQFESLESKFDRMIARGNGVSETARLALACKLMMYTGIRIGNEGSAEGYMTKPHPNSTKEPRFVQTYGLTTLLPEHVIVAPRKVCLNFLGKKQVENSFVLTGKLAKQVKAVYESCEQPETLFDITAYSLTKFIKTYVGSAFKPKDFRTMRANMFASEKLSEISKRKLPATKRELNSEIREVLEFVSGHLNNTPGVCKASYVDHLIWDDVMETRPVTKTKQK